VAENVTELEPLSDVVAVTVWLVTDPNVHVVDAYPPPDVVTDAEPTEPLFAPAVNDTATPSMPLPEASTRRTFGFTDAALLPFPV
jgi:hypothetical protein